MKTMKWAVALRAGGLEFGTFVDAPDSGAAITKALLAIAQPAQAVGAMLAEGKLDAPPPAPPAKPAKPAEPAPEAEAPKPEGEAA